MLHLESLDKARIRLFAAACASRTAGVLQHFASEISTTECAFIIDELWTLASNPDRKKQSELRRRISLLPEASIDDPYERQYYAMRAMGVVDEAIGACGAESELTFANAASDAAISLASDLTFETGIAIPEELTHKALISAIEALPDASPTLVKKLSSINAWSKLVFERLDQLRGWSTTTT